MGRNFKIGDWVVLYPYGGKKMEVVDVIDGGRLYKVRFHHPRFGFTQTFNASEIIHA